MFTGIVESVAQVEALRGRGGGLRLVFRTRRNLGRLSVGGSIAINGVCLTVVTREKRRYAADLGPETLSRTTLGSLHPGDRVHVERPLRLGDPLGGHLVTGHVDGVGEVRSRRERASALELSIATPPALARLLAPQGSIAVDGVSLTISRLRGSVFRVVVIPHTLAVTCLGERRAGDRVNIEADLIAKHIARLTKRNAD